MKRMTTDDVRNDASSGPIGCVTRMLNYAYAEDDHVKLLYAGGTEAAALCDYVAQCAKQYTDCAIYPCDVRDGACLECDCPIAILNIVAIQAAELRARLMMIKDILGEDYDLSHLRELVKAERRWIPVTERLPEEFGQWVLVTDGRCVSKGYVLNYENKTVSPWCAIGPVYCRDITHWMPLPMPAKEGV